MKIAIGSDEKTKTTDALVYHLKSQGRNEETLPLTAFGPLKDNYLNAHDFNCHPRI